MALQLGAFRDALLETGASEQNAREAADEVAADENRLVSIEGRLIALDNRLVSLEQQVAELRSYIEHQITELRTYVDLQIARLRREIRLIGGVTIALLVPILVKLFVHG